MFEIAQGFFRTMIGLVFIPVIMGSEALRQALFDERVVAPVGDGGAQDLQPGKQAVSTKSIVANHVLARAELGVKEPQGFRRRGAEALAAVEERNEFFHAVELDDRAFEAGVAIGDSTADFVGFLQARVEDVRALEGFANAADGVGEGFEFGDFVLGEFAQQAEQRTEAGRNERPAFVQAELLVLEPARIAEAVEKLAGALAGVAEGCALVVGEHDVRVGGEDFPDQRDRLGMGYPPGLTRDVGEAFRAIDVNRRRWPGQRTEKVPRDRGEEFFTEIRRGHAAEPTFMGAGRTTQARTVWPNLNFRKNRVASNACGSHPRGC